MQFTAGDRSREPLRLFCGEVLRRWPHLAASDVLDSRGEPSKLIAMLQKTYEYSAARAEKELHLLIKEFGEKLYRAA